MDTVATAFAAILTAITGILGWQLSARAQRASAARQKAIDQGPYVESLQAWSREIVAWYKTQMTDAERECQAELERQRLACEEQLRRAAGRGDYWKRRALGQPVGDHTPPPDTDLSAGGS